ncbi:hypothetical protein QQG55_50515 [Brugia pahangi]
MEIRSQPYEKIKQSRNGKWLGEKWKCSIRQNDPNSEVFSRRVRSAIITTMGDVQVQQCTIQESFLQPCPS